MNNNKIKEAVKAARNNESIIELIQGDICNKSILRAAVDYHVTRLNALFDRETITPGEDAIYIGKMNAAVKMYNALVVEERFDEFKAMSEEEAFKAYLDDQITKGVRVSLDAETNRYEISENDITLRFSDFLAATRPTEVNGIMDAIAIFVDNLARRDCNNDAAYVSKHSIHPDYIRLRNNLGWDDISTNSAILRQLNKLVNTFILPKDINIKMIDPDVRYIRTGAVKSVDKANKPGAYVQRNDETLCGFIFRAIYTRWNSFAYEFQKTRAQDKGTYKTYPQTTAEKRQDKARNATPDDITPVSVFTPEEAATATKKEIDQ